FPVYRELRLAFLLDFGRGECRQLYCCRRCYLEAGAGLAHAGFAAIAAARAAASASGDNTSSQSPSKATWFRLGAFPSANPRAKAVRWGCACLKPSSINI